MKNFTVIIIGVILIFLFSMQVVMFYRIHERIDQQFTTEKNLDLSSHQGASDWPQKSDDWTPFQELLKIQNRIEQLFNNSLSRLQNDTDAAIPSNIPALNLKEEADRYVVTIDVPGADESSINVELNGRKLTLSVSNESEQEQTGNNGKFIRHERYQGLYTRTLILPGNIDPASMKTEYDNGVLTITLAKA